MVPQINQARRYTMSSLNVNAKKIEELEQRLLDAQIKGDKSFLEGLLSDEYIGIDPDGGRVCKSEEIENLSSSGYTSGSLKDVGINLHGNTAIVTGKLELSKDNLTQNFFFTDVFVEDKLVACHAVLA